MADKIRVYIAGIINGSKDEKSIHAQDYRQQIIDVLKNRASELDIYNPFLSKEAVLDLTEDGKRRFFLGNNAICSNETDVLIAYIPEASMGSAIEMWEAYKNGACVISITPMANNWTVKFTSNLIYSTLDDFISGVRNGELDSYILK